MAAVIKNSLNEAVLWANTTFTWVPGNTAISNTTVASVQYVNSDGVYQNVTSMSIRKIICATVNNTSQWVITRGANQVFAVGGNFTFDFAAHNMILNQDPTANLTATLTGGGTILIDISKAS